MTRIEHITKMMHHTDFVYEDEYGIFINMNDEWGFASADTPYIPMDEMLEVGRLFSEYGYCGLLYWYSEREGKMKSMFDEINRKVEFVRQEESKNGANS